MAPVIVAKDLHKCYPGFAPVLRGANIAVEAGEVAAIMGPSGCGKSTMLHILGMLHAPDSGSLEILGQNVLTFDREQTAAFRRGNMGFVMQSSNLFEHSTVFENVEFPLIYENVPPQERWARVIHALDLVRLSARVHYRSNRLSGGEQQRVAIARAMVNNPRILLADEPTGALDARTSRLIMENFRKLCHSGGVSMIMVTHDPKMADFCDSVYTLEEGVLVCKKHGTGPYTAKVVQNLLTPPEPLVRGALVTGRFPPPPGNPGLALATSMNSQKLLSRIYSIYPSAFLGNPEGYALPLPIRHIGHWQRLSAIKAFFQRARGHQSLWELWRKLPAHEHAGHGLWQQITAFACGARLASWGMEDSLEYLHGAEPGQAATAAWTAAALLRKPFGFSLDSHALVTHARAVAGMAADAVLVTCPTRAAMAEFRRIAPDVAPEKIILLRPLILDGPQEDEAEKNTSIVKPAQILLINPAPASLRLMLKACAALKRMKTDFHLWVSGLGGWRWRFLAWRMGLSAMISFQRHMRADGLGEMYRNADIFIAMPPPEDRFALPTNVCMAMAYGLATVVEEMTPGLAEGLKANESCLVAETGKAISLAENLARLANSPDLRQQLGSAARISFRELMNDDDGNRLADIVVMAAGLADRAASGAKE